jgi:uncharacterized membrane protein YhaH (DUF805 family)
MGFGQAVRSCLGKYGTFSGRASRSEFWWFYLFTAIVTGIPIFIGAILFVSAASANSGDMEASGDISALGLVGILFYILGFLLALALAIPNLSVGCRRLHDRGTSGWLQLLILVPCGNIVLLIFWLLEGTNGDNIYGPKSTNA